MCKSHIANMAELPVVSDAEFRTAMQVFGLPIDEKSEENGREVVLFTKTANGKAIGQPLTLFHNLTNDLKDVKRSIRLVLADTIENCTPDEIVVDQMYYVRKQSKANTVFMIVNNSGMDQVFQEYPKTMKNGHKGAPIRLAVDWHFRGEFCCFIYKTSVNLFSSSPLCLLLRLFLILTL